MDRKVAPNLEDTAVRSGGFLGRFFCHGGLIIGAIFRYAKATQ
jgi:hypothetical protein